jgi:hypothetical protein
MNKLLRAVVVIAGSIVLILLLLGSLPTAIPIDANTINSNISVAILIDDFAPQPLPGQTFWPHNQLGGDRGRIDGPGCGDGVG